MLYNALNRLIDNGETEGLLEKMDMFMLFNRLTSEEYSNLVAKLKEKTTVNNE